jgi:hypothetical protein
MVGDSGWGDALYANARKLGFMRILLLRAKGVIFNFPPRSGYTNREAGCDTFQGPKQRAALGLTIPLIVRPLAPMAHQG